MSTMQILGTRENGDEVWSDLELPGWDEFTGARDRFFASLNRAHPPNTAEGPDTVNPAPESPR